MRRQTWNNAAIKLLTLDLRFPQHGVVVLVRWLKAFRNARDPHGAQDLARPSAHLLEQFPHDAFQAKIKLKVKKRAAGACS